MPRFTLQQQWDRSCGAACSAVAIAELLNRGAPTQEQERLAYVEVSRRYIAGRINDSEDNAPAKIARYLRRQGLRASIVESPTRSLTLLAAAWGTMAPAWRQYSGELWREWVWRWPRGLRERDFDNGGRAIMAVYTADGMHFLLARREGGAYFVMDPAFGSDTQVDAATFASWAGMHWGDRQSWNPLVALHTAGSVQHPDGRDNNYLGVAVWANAPTAPYVLY